MDATHPFGAALRPLAPLALHDDAGDGSTPLTRSLPRPCACCPQFCRSTCAGRRAARPSTCLFGSTAQVRSGVVTRCEGYTRARARMAPRAAARAQGQTHACIYATHTGPPTHIGNPTSSRSRSLNLALLARAARTLRVCHGRGTFAQRACPWSSGLDRAGGVPGAIQVSAMGGGISRNIERARERANHLSSDDEGAPVRPLFGLAARGDAGGR